MKGQDVPMANRIEERESVAGRVTCMQGQGQVACQHAPLQRRECVSRLYPATMEHAKVLGNLAQGKKVTNI
jgi:hypothetical protein